MARPESNGAGESTTATTDDPSVSAGKSLEGGGLEIVMPEMGESVTEGTVLEWHVSEGDQIAEGDTVVEVSTDKVDAEVPAPASGTITKILVGPDETIEVGKPLAEMTKGEAPSADGGATRVAKPDAPTPDTAAAEGEVVAGDGEAVSQAANATPVARRAAQANGVDLAGVKGSGPGGKITKADVLNGGDGAAPAKAAERRGDAAARTGRHAGQGDGREPLDSDGNLVP